MISDEMLDRIAATLSEDLYNDKFGAKSCGPFSLSRPQFLSALGVPKLNTEIFSRFQEICLFKSLIVIDLDDEFIFLSRSSIANIRQVPGKIFQKHFKEFVVHGQGSPRSGRRRGIRVEEEDDDILPRNPTEDIESF